MCLPNSKAQSGPIHTSNAARVATTGHTTSYPVALMPLCCHCRLVWALSHRKVHQCLVQSDVRCHPGAASRNCCQRQTLLLHYCQGQTRLPSKNTACNRCMPILKMEGQHGACLHSNEQGCRHANSKCRQMGRPSSGVNVAHP